MLKQKWFKIVLLTLFSGSVWAATASTFVFNAQATPDIVRAVDFARANQKAVVIQGTVNNSAENSGAVYLNLHDFKDLITLHLKKKTMLVESGMTWNEAQQLVAPFGLSLKFIPAQANTPIFQTINDNQSGLSPQNPLVADGITAIRLLQPDGEIVNVSRNDKPELWRGLFGAQGALGVILDVQLKLVENRNLIRHAARLSYRDYPAYLRDQIQDNPDVSAGFARIDVVPGKDFLNDMYVVSYWVKDREAAESPRLHPVRNHLASSVYQWSEKGDWAKRMRWQIETALLGNTVFHSELTRADLLLRQARATTGQARQVYYIPVAQFVPFMDDLRTLATTQKWSFNQISVHYLEKSSDLLLAPQQGNTLAMVVNTAKMSGTESQAITSALMDLALKHDGSFALDQSTTQDLAKVKLAYPEFNQFQQLKETYDAKGLFVSMLYPSSKVS